MLEPHHHVKTFLFGNYDLCNSGYYGLMSTCEMGAFDFLGDVLFMNQSTWTKPAGGGYLNDWCDTGYQNLAATVSDTTIGWVYYYGLMETASRRSPRPSARRKRSGSRASTGRASPPSASNWSAKARRATPAPMEQP
jgi:hypothetical protein